MTALEGLEKDFALSVAGMRRIIRDMNLEMTRALSGKRSSLKMIPTYVGRPTGEERGEFLALDLGGTNFRVISLVLKGHGDISGLHVMKFALKKRDITSTDTALFGFLARSVKKFIKKENLGLNPSMSLGFTFSFPVKQTSIAGGKLVAWTKGFSARGVVGRDVVELLRKALLREGLSNLKVEALANDTVGTFVARAYSDRSCDMGVIIGTGTNACYVEDKTIINIEWGNFDKLKCTVYDRQLDAYTDNPSSQRLEKMVSGMYLGELVRLALCDISKRRLLFKGKIPPKLAKPMSLKSEHVSSIESDRSAGLSKIGAILKDLGAPASCKTDRMIVRAVCCMISRRAARISASAIAGVITRIDPNVSKRHVVAIDGSVYEKHFGFSKELRAALKEILGKRAHRIALVLSKDGSGKGSAIIAAVASSGVNR